MPQTIMIVDDNPHLLAGAKMTLEMNGYDVIPARDGYEALQRLERIKPDLIVSDIMMPGCDGFRLLEIVHERPEWVTIPFLFLTVLDDEASLTRGRALGVDDYLTKPFSPDTLAQVVKGRLERANSLRDAHTTEAYLHTIVVMAKAIEGRDSYTGGHVERVSTYAEALARELGWSEKEISEVRLAGILHDVGKVCIPDGVLNKSGKLTPGEWQIMKSHPEVGSQILQPLKHLPLILDGVRHHHERYDGYGYPDGLAREEIPEIGRLLAVVDSFDAMTSHRPYRKGMKHEKAMAILQEGAGSQFDPQMVQAFLVSAHFNVNQN